MDVSLLQLWAPILLSAVLVFVASSILHMVVPWHCGDYRGLPDEDRITEAMRQAGVRPGMYMIPYCNSMKEIQSEQMTEKYRRGPVGFVTIRPSGSFNMAPNLAVWFLYSIVIGVFSGYVATQAFKAGTPYMDIFQMTGTVAILGYALSSIPDSIWKGQSWWITFKFMIDGTIYGLLTAGCFGWLWPGA